jgi:hypothetical protein
MIVGEEIFLMKYQQKLNLAWKNFEMLCGVHEKKQK